MTWEVGTNRPVIGQASGATRGACARQWSRDRIVWCDAMEEGLIWNSQGAPLVVSSRRKLVAKEERAEIGALDRCRTE